MDGFLPQADGTSIAAVLTGIVTPSNHLVGVAAIPWPLSTAKPGSLSTPCLRRESPPPKRRICTSTTSMPTTAASSNGRFNGVATKNLPSYLGWRRALEAWGQQVDPPSWINSAIGNGPYQQTTLRANNRALIALSIDLV